MNPFEMVVLIVAMGTVASVLKARYGYGRRRRDGLIDSDLAPSAQEQAETMRLRDEVRQLKERIHVLERIAVDKEDTLSRQIDELRDR